MMLEEYRIECGWSKAQMARHADIDINTLNRALEGEVVAAGTANKIARAISKELGRTIRARNIEGLNTKL